MPSLVLARVRRALAVAWVVALALPGCSTSMVSGMTSASEIETDGDGSTSGSTSDASSAGDATGGTGPASSGTSTTGSDDSGGTSDTSGAGSDPPVGQPWIDALDRCDPVIASTLEMVLHDSNAEASPVLARMSVEGGWLSPGALTIRPWEFLAYYPFTYAPAKEPGTVAVHAALVPSAEGYDFQVGVASSALAPSERPFIDLTLVVDASGSMKGLPLTLLKESCKALASQLRKGDRVSVVTLESDAPPVLAEHWVTGPDDADLLAVIDGLGADGNTDLLGGLEAAYALAESIYQADRPNRLVLLSDGGAAPDAAVLGLVAKYAAGEGSPGIALIGAGVGGYGAYQPDFMNAVSDAGEGASVFVGSAEEALRSLADGFVDLMMVGARDVSVHVALPPGLARPLAAVEIAPDADLWVQEPLLLPQNDALVYFTPLESCGPPPAADAPVLIDVTYRDPVTFEAREVKVETTFGELLGADADQLAKGAAILAYAEALRLWTSPPMDAPLAHLDAAAAALDRVKKALAGLPGDPALVEIAGVLEAILAGNP